MMEKIFCSTKNQGVCRQLQKEISWKILSITCGLLLCMKKKII